MTRLRSEPRDLSVAAMPVADVFCVFAEKAGAVRDGVLHQARVEASFLPAEKKLEFLNLFDAAAAR